MPATLDLLTDRPRPRVQAFHGANLPVTLPRELSENLSAFSRRHNVTLFMTLLAAFQVLLSRHTHQDDIAVGVPIANRHRAELEPMIGLFANTLVLRAKFRGDEGFADVLAQVKETSLAAYNHQDIPKASEAVRGYTFPRRPVLLGLLALTSR